MSAFVLFLVVDGFLFARYWLTTDAAVASAPSLDAVPATYKEAVGAGEQEEPAVTETTDEAEQPNGEKQGILGAGEAETDPTLLSTPDPATTAQGADQPVAAAVDTTGAAVSPAPVSAPAYAEPVQEE